MALYACMYFAALRPGEAVALRRQDCYLPATGWGLLTLEKIAARSQPALDRHRVSAQGTRPQAPPSHRRADHVQAMPLTLKLVGEASLVAQLPWKPND